MVSSDHTGSIISLKFNFNMLPALFLFRAGASPMLICLQPPTMHQKDQQCKERSPWKELQNFFSGLSKETQYRLRPIIFTLQGTPMANWIFFYLLQDTHLFSIFEYQLCIVIQVYKEDEVRPFALGNLNLQLPGTHYILKNLWVMCIQM